jgi:hypothetical protein
VSPKLLEGDFIVSDLDAIRKRAAAPVPCPECGDSGFRWVRTGRDLETDSPAERARNWAKAPCPVCCGRSYRQLCEDVVSLLSHFDFGD